MSLRGRKPDEISSVGLASRPSSFPRTRSREARDILDPGSESGVMNDRRFSVPVGMVPPIRVCRRFAPRNYPAARGVGKSDKESGSWYEPASFELVFHPADRLPQSRILF